MTLTVRTNELKENMRKKREDVNKARTDKIRNKYANDLVTLSERYELSRNLLQFIS